MSDRPSPSKCPYCSSDRCKIEYDLTWKDERFATYHVARCGDCDVGFVLPLPTPDELNELYNSLQYHEEDRSTINYADASDEVIDNRVKKDGRILQKYAPHFPSSGKILDIGAGWGTLLKFFTNQGYQTVGLELSTVTSQFATERLGLEIHNLPVEQLDQVPGGPFDLITMRHTLEHFYEQAGLHSAPITCGTSQKPVSTKFLKTTVLKCLSSTNTCRRLCSVENHFHLE